nr:hypothetical protein CoNPh38_CDS0308 [Staphylococcus phage S-CoN_Ph38]
MIILSKVIYCLGNEQTNQDRLRYLYPRTMLLNNLLVLYFYISYYSI